MGTARSILFTVSSVIMIVAGAGSIACAAFLTEERLNAPDASMPITFISAAIMLIFSVINIISGINGLRCHNKRINSAVVIRLPEISVVFCLISIGLTLFNGILFGYIIVLIVTGILVPILFIYAAARKSYL